MKHSKPTLFLVLSVLICTSLFLPSCSQSTRRETTSVIREEPSDPQGDPESKRVIIEKTETVTETEESCGGILSCTVDVVGAIIALPFKAVGFLIGVIF